MAIVWDPSCKLLTLGSFFELRWYNLLFGIAFTLAFPLWQYMFAREGKDPVEAERSKSYLIIGIIVGARLGHFLFYDWDVLKSNFLSILLPFEFYPKFRVVGFSGLSSHGAVCGALLAIFFYAKRLQVTSLRISLTERKSKGTFLWILDHLVILVALGGALVRIGNFTNSEIIGKPTKSSYGVVFAASVREALYAMHPEYIQKPISFGKVAQPPTTPTSTSYQPIEVRLTFKEVLKDEQAIRNFLEGSFKKSLVRLSREEQPMIYEPYGKPLVYTLSNVKDHYQAAVYTLGIPRHPSQLYESFSCLLLFILLFAWWYAKGSTIAPGRLTGAFATIVFTLRFLQEYLKENQALFEDNLPFNMGQFLSLPLIAMGLFLIFRPNTTKKSFM